ncbi:MAG: DUF1289 domain-containing protein [Defluviimonas sp.]|nr:DUF1289 domain-containing protein [Defluviimonas sp.]
MSDTPKRGRIESPCIKLCAIHPAEGICIGCYRTLAEIGGWSTMSPEARRAVMADLPARAPRVAGAQAGGRGGGRGGRLRLRRKDQ